MNRAQALTIISSALSGSSAGNRAAKVVSQIVPTIQNKSRTWDNHTNRRIQSLHPKVQPHAISFINEAETALSLRLRISQATRTIVEQNALYAQGRTTPGKIVTYAQGGQSYHNYGLAIDVVEIRSNGQPNWNLDWISVSKIAKKHNFSWGGDWRKPDKPHFQMTFGLSIKQLQNGQRP